MKLIIALASSGSISKAAKKLFKSQPNVSKELKDLEEKYHTKLFERTHTGVTITETGEIFLNTSKKILSELSMLKLACEHLQNTPREIHIGSVKLVYCLKGIQEWVDSLLLDKNHSVFVHEDSVLEIIDKVASGQYTIGYISVPAIMESHINRTLESNKIISKEIVKYRKQLLIHNDHPLAEKKNISEDDLKGYPEIVIGSNNVLNEEHDACVNDGKKVVVDGIGSVLGYMNFVKGSYVWIAPIPKEVLSENGLFIKPSKIRKQMMKDFIIFKEASEELEITKSFVDSKVSFIKKWKI